MWEPGVLWALEFYRCTSFSLFLLKDIIMVKPRGGHGLGWVGFCLNPQPNPNISVCDFLDPRPAHYKANPNQPNPLVIGLGG